jgi:hypothetical protein
MKEYNIEYKILDLKYTKSKGLVIEVKYEVIVSLDGISKSKIDTKKFRKSKNFIPLEELTEGIVINWVKNDKRQNRHANDHLILSLKKLVEIEINSPLKNGLPWEK